MRDKAAYKAVYKTKYGLECYFQDIEDIASEIKEMATLYGLRLLDPQKVPKHVQG